SPGQPDSSKLIQAIRYGDDLRMPPKGKLSNEQIAVLTTWIKLGARWPDNPKAVRGRSTERLTISGKDRAFGSCPPVKQPLVPDVRDKSWARTPIDAFVLAKLEERGLHPVAPAEKRTLLRRATFDLIGLPPTIEEIEAFLADDSTDA